MGWMKRPMFLQKLAKTYFKLGHPYPVLAAYQLSSDPQDDKEQEVIHIMPATPGPTLVSTYFRCGLILQNILTVENVFDRRKVMKYKGRKFYYLLWRTSRIWQGKVLLTEKVVHGFNAMVDVPLNNAEARHEPQAAEYPHHNQLQYVLECLQLQHQRHPVSMHGRQPL